MKKIFLTAFFWIVFLTIACKSKQTYYDPQAISNDFWSQRNRVDDSLLYISIYKETKKYVHYFTKMKAKPFLISSRDELCFIKIDKQTIFKTECLNSANNELIRERLLAIGKAPILLDESLLGSVYIFNKNEPDKFKVISMPYYFENISGLVPRKAMSTAEENSYFDKFSDQVWNQENSSEL